MLSGREQAAVKSAIEKTRLVSEVTELRRSFSDVQDRAFLFWDVSPEMQTIASVIEQVSGSDKTLLNAITECGISRA